MSEWKPIKGAPYQTVIEVRNSLMEKPVRATRGFMTEIGVHPDDTFCTSVFTPDEFFPYPAGQLVCATEFRLIEEPS